MAQIDRTFVAIALVYLILGMLLGFYMGASSDNSFLDAHVAMLMGGFVLLTIYGLTYRLWPAMKESPLAKVQFWIANIGAIGIVAGAVQMVLGGGIITVAAGSALAIVGAVLMAWLFVTRGM
jgi:hypothetical protein